MSFVWLCLTLSVCRCPSISPRFGNRLPTHTHTQIYVTVQCSEWTHSTVVIIDFTIYLPSLSLFSSVPKLAPLGCAVLLLSLSVSLCFVSLSICRSLLVVLTSVVSQSLFEVKCTVPNLLPHFTSPRIFSPCFFLRSHFPTFSVDFVLCFLEESGILSAALLFIGSFASVCLLITANDLDVHFLANEELCPFVAVCSVSDLYL